MLGMHREDSKTSMCILKLDNKLDEDAKKSFCLLRFEINGTSAAEDLENFAMFSVHRVFYTSTPWSWIETCQTLEQEFFSI